MQKTLQNKRYSIISMISKGGFGITYKALRTEDNYVVCIKEFYIDSICKTNLKNGFIEPMTKESIPIFNKFRDAFIKEAKTLKSLSCNNIIRVFDVFEENGTAYYVMEFIDGHPLSEIVPQNGFNENTALTIIKQILSATKYIHERKITHLDIKPSNILIRKNGEIVLIDFGGSKRYSENGEQTSSSPLSKSEGYAPIELYKEQGLKEFNPATDIYEIGATFYNLVTGEIPPSASEIMDEGNPIVYKKLSSYIKNTIKLAMEPGIKNRIKSVDHFEQCLKQELNDNEKTTFKELDDTDLGKKEQRKRSLFTNKYLLISLGIIFIIIVTFFIINRNGNEKINSSDVQEYEDVLLQRKDTIEMIKTELNNFVSEQNLRKHKDIAGLKIDSLVLTDRGLEYFVSISKAGKTLYKELVNNKSTRKDMMIAGLKNDTKLFEISKKLAKLDLSLIFHYTYQNSNDEIIIELSCFELSSIKMYEGSHTDRMNQQFVDMAENITKQCPQKIDDGLNMVKCEFKQNKITYFYSCTQEYYEYISTNLNTWKEDIAYQLYKDETMKAFTKICANQGVYIQYEYKNNNTGNRISITYNTLTKKFD